MSSAPNLIIDIARADISRYYRAHPESTLINGGLVFYSEALRALARYSKVNKLLFLNVGGDPPIDHSELGDELLHSDRVTFIDSDSISTLNAIPNPIFFTPTEQASILSGIRQSFGMHTAPLFSFLHAADTNWFLPHYAAYIMRGAQSFDALICSSNAGRQVVTALHDRLYADGLHSATPQLPMVPLAIFPDEVCSVPKPLARVALDIPDDACCILYFGRLEMIGKADLCPLLLLLDSLSKSLQTPICVVCAGGDKPRNTASKLQTFAASFIPHLNLRIYANPDEDLKRTLLASADIFVSPADGIRETFGLSLLEAMATGLPLITTDWSGYREIVEDGQNGFLIPTAWQQNYGSAERFAALGCSQDEVLSSTTSFDMALMEQALRILISNKTTRERFGRRSRELVSEYYSWPIIVSRYDDLFDQHLRLARETTSSSRYPYVQDLFSHYPTKILSSATRYQRGPLYSGSLVTDMHKTTYRPAWISDSIMKVIETHIIQCCYVSLDALARYDIDPHAASLHLGRLCKYGLLTVVVESSHT